MARYKFYIVLYCIVWVRLACSPAIASCRGGQDTEAGEAEEELELVWAVVVGIAVEIAVNSEVCTLEVCTEVGIYDAVIQRADFDVALV